MRRAKKCLSLLLAAALVLLSVPFSVHAENRESVPALVQTPAPCMMEVPQEPLPDPNAPEVQSFAEVKSYDETELYLLLEEKLKEGILEGKESVDISDMGIDINSFSLYSMMFYSPYFSNGINLKPYYDPATDCYSYVNIENTMNIGETSVLFALLDQKIQDLTALVSGEIPDEQKVLLLHEYLVHEYEYDWENYLAGTLEDGSDSFRSGGILINEIGVCNAYAYLFKYILDRTDIPCRVVASDSMNHAWNLVQIGDSWYHVDTTYDDPTWDKLGKVRHEYFLLSDAEMEKRDHYGWDAGGIECNNTQYDNMWWRSADSQIILDNGYAYYIESYKEGETDHTAVRKRSISGNTVTDIKEMPAWMVWESFSSRWSGAYSGLFLYEGRLYYNTPSEIRKMTLEGQEDTLVYKPDTTEGYVYGCRRHGSQLQYALRKDPNEQRADKISVPFPDLKAPSGITLSREKLEMEVTDNATITYTLSPAGALSDVTWTSGNPAVAGVTNGTITAHSVGTTRITAKTGNNLTAVCEVTVREKQPVQYTVSFDAYDGVVSLKKKTVTLGKPYGPLPVPEREGYVFLGWYTSAVGGRLVTEDTLVDRKADHSLYARWTNDAEFSITYELGGGTNSEKNPSVYRRTSDTITLEDPTRLGYTFAGWYETQDGTKRVSQIVKGSAGNKTFYARWTAVEYTITYVMNGGTNNVSNPAKYTIEFEEITLVEPEYAGHIFDGWFTDEACTIAGGKIAKGSTGNKTFYAKWSEEEEKPPVTEEKEYTITYMLDGGTNHADNPLKYTSKTDTIVLKDPVREGYTFAGWYADQNYTVQVTQIAKGSTGNKIFYAKWTKEETQPPVPGEKEYTITYVLDGGTNHADNPSKYTEETDTIVLRDPTREGYTFIGWFADQEFNEQVTQIAKGSTGDKTFYAKWEEENLDPPNPPIVTEYAITYVLDGGTNHADNPSKYTEETDTILLKEPAREGYVFEGWYADEAYTRQVTQIDKGSKGDITLYAKWKQKVSASFDDVAAGDWYYNAVQYVFERGIMTGKTDTHFGSGELLARAQFTLMLYRMEGSPEVEYQNTFGDIPEGLWYTDAVLWANSVGIVTGYTSTKTFGPADFITREQLATMMFRYANYKKQDTSSRAGLEGFPDGNTVTGYAMDAVQWAVAKGIISGDKGMLKPQDNTNRAVCATIIMRYLNGQ